MCQLFLPIPGINQRDESPRFQACCVAKKRWESFIAYQFNLSPDNQAYHEIFPHLDAAKDLDCLSATDLEYLRDFYNEAYQELRIQIWMTNNWDVLNNESRLQALEHWVEWCDVVCYSPSRYEILVGCSNG